MPKRANDPIYSLTLRRLLVALVVIPILTIFVVMYLHHKAAINIEDYNIPEIYLYGGALGVILVGGIIIALIWRCPSCGAYLGKEFNPASCTHCGAALK